MKILVNCALPYASGPLHLGHIAGAYLGPDIFVRFQRMMGNEVVYISGSDEYGTPITIKADKEHKSPKEIADFYHNEHLSTFRSLDINFDIFSRTTDPMHTETTSEFFLDLLKKGYLVERSMIAPYCPGCERFMPDRYIVGTCPNCGYKDARGDQCDECGKTLDARELINPICSLCGTVPEFRETNHFFLRLDLLQDQLLEWINTKKDWRPNVINFTRNFIKSGLKERPITRDLDWGVPIPINGYEHKRIYVWFEALIGYISASRIYFSGKNEPDEWKSYWQDQQVPIYNFMGKDNIEFHTIIWPAMLMAKGGLNLPYRVVANEYLRFRGEKFSKSRGIGFTVDEILNIVPKDYLRYYMASNLPEGGDTNFSMEELVDRVNTEYIDKFGNFVNRIVSFSASHFPEVTAAGEYDTEDVQVINYTVERFEAWKRALEDVQIKKGLQEWLDLVKYANSYFNRSKPWDLIRNDREACLRKLHVSLGVAEALAMMIYPYTPSSSELIRKMIGSGNLSIPPSLFSTRTYNPIKGEPPFKKMDITAANPNSMDLVVGKILEVSQHPNADKLYLIRVSFGDSETRIVSGLRDFYTADQLLGRKIIVVRNLKKARIRGEDSNGMLLAADNGDIVKLLAVPDQVVEGSTVSVNGYPYNGKGIITIDEVHGYSMKAECSSGICRVQASVDGKRGYLQVSSEYVFVSEKVMDGCRVK
ncbi:MAG: methionine--tRNA ligase [Thermoplasmataceae archaeon]